MAQARSVKMPVGTPGTYHVVSRCTRREFLLGGAYEHRREWVMDELHGLLGSFAIDLQAYAVMSNHVHLILRPRPDKVASLSAERIARIGMGVMPVRSGNADEKFPVTDEIVSRYAGQTRWVKEYSKRLSSISWFMRLFKQHIAKAANQEDNCSGHFWESRFFCVPLLDWSAVLACMVYVDLNPWRAGLCKTLGKTQYSSLCAHADLQIGKEDRALSTRLSSLAQSPPVDSYTGVLSRSSLSTADYRSLLASAAGTSLPKSSLSAAATLLQELGIDPERWSTGMQSPGLFQSAAVGSIASRKQYAATVKRKWIADKTKLWLPENES